MNYKKYLTSKNIFMAIFVVMLIGIFFRFVTLLSFPDSSTVLRRGELLKLLPKDSISQTFAADRNGLAKIDFLMRTPGPKKLDAVVMQLADASCQDIIRQGTLERSFLNSDNLYDFRFSPIPDSAGKKYCVIAIFKPKAGGSKFIRFFIVENSDPDFALTDITGTAQYPDQSLSMRAAYKNDGLFQSVRELNQRVSQYKPWFLKHYWLSAIVISFVFLSIATVTILIII